MVNCILAYHWSFVLYDVIFIGHYIRCLLTIDKVRQNIFSETLSLLADFVESVVHETKHTIFKYQCIALENTLPNNAL